MRQIHIKLQRNDDVRNWSIEINGRLHEHVADDSLSDLVEGALIVAAKSLIRASGNARTSKALEATTPGVSLWRKAVDAPVV